MGRAFARRSKYKNVPTNIDGVRFASKHEAACYKALCRLYGKERVLCQVSLKIGDARIVPDFMVLEWVPEYCEGEATPPLFTAFLADAKGMVTPAWKAKANHLFDKHGLEIRILDKKWLKENGG